MSTRLHRPPPACAATFGSPGSAATCNESGAISVAGLTEPFSVVVTIAGSGSAFGGSCASALNGTWYLNVVKSSGSFTVELRNPTDGSTVNAGDAISFSYIAITNN